jgi:hypothetical protein
MQIFDCKSAVRRCDLERRWSDPGLETRLALFGFLVFFAPRLRSPARASAAGPAPRVASLRVAASSVADSVSHNFFYCWTGTVPMSVLTWAATLLANTSRLNVHFLVLWSWTWVP